MTARTIDVVATLRELEDRLDDEPGFFPEHGPREGPRERRPRADGSEGSRVTLALMTIVDTERAIRAFRKPTLRKLSPEVALKRRAEDKEWEWPGVGTAYLTKYGLLQAMQLQQLAAETVATGLGFTDLKLDTTNVPRIARHNAAAHPFSDKGLQEDHFLDRSSIFENTLKIMSFAPDSEWRGRTEHIPDLKRLQRELIVTFLVEIIESIDARQERPKG